MFKHRDPIANRPTLDAIIQGASPDDQSVLAAMLCKCADADWQALEKAVEQYISAISSAS